jgi:hypothetical protein
MTDLSLAADTNTGVSLSLPLVDLTGYALEMIVSARGVTYTATLDDGLDLVVSGSGDTLESLVTWNYTQEQSNALPVGARTKFDLFGTFEDVRSKLAAGTLSIDGAGELTFSSAAASVPGIQGARGWAPIFSAVLVGSSIAMRVEDWTGGGGDKPATGQYLGPDGLVDDAAEATLFASVASAQEAIADAAAQADLAQSYAQQADVARADAVLAAAATNANLDAAPVFFTEADLLAYAPADVKPASLAVNSGSRKRGVYRRTSGQWPSVRESDILAGVDERVADIESRNFVDPDNEFTLPNNFVRVFRGLNGGIVAGITSEGKIWFIPTDDLLSFFRPENPVYQSVTVGVGVDENPYITIIPTSDGKALVRATKAGEIDFLMAPELARRTRRSDLARIQVTDRPPLESDDTNAGYAVGNSWVYGQQLWVCTQAYPTAIWEPARQFFLECGNTWSDGRLPLPGDALWDAVPVVAISGRRMRADYTGPALQARRDADGALLDIGFASNDLIDWPSLRRFMNGGRARLEKIYNQGSGDDLTWTGGNRPVLSPCPMVGNSIGIIIENGTPYNGADPEEGILIPSSIAYDSDNMSFFWAGSPAHSQTDIPLVEFSGYYPLGFGNRNRSGHIGFAAHSNNSWRFSEWKAHIGAQVIGFSSSTEAFTMHLSDEQVMDFNPYPHQALAGGLIGLVTAGWLSANGLQGANGDQIMGGILIYDRAVTKDEAALIRRSMELHFDMRPQIRGTFIMDGDSIEHGAYATYYESIARRMSRYLIRPMKIYLIARGGGTFGSQTGFWEEMSTITSYSKPVIGACALGTNDIGHGDVASSDELMALAADYFARWRSDGVQYIIGQNIRPRRGFADAGGGALEVLRQEYNARFRAEWNTTLGLDAVADVATLPIVGVDGAAHDPSLYIDGTHQTDYARSLEAPWIAAITNGVIIANGWL